MRDSQLLRRKRLGLGLAIAGGWFAPLLALWAGGEALLIARAGLGLALLIAGLFLIGADRNDPAVMRDMAVAIGLSAAATGAVIALLGFPWGPFLLFGAAAMITTVILVAGATAVGSPRPLLTIATVVACLVGTAVVTAAGFWESFVWFPEAIDPAASIDHVYGALLPHEIDSIRRQATGWVVACAIAMTTYLAVSVLLFRKTGTRRVLIVGLCLPALLLVWLQWGSFSLGSNLTDFLPIPEDYPGGQLRQLTIAILFAAASAVALTGPARERVAEREAVPAPVS